MINDDKLMPLKYIVWIDDIGDYRILSVILDKIPKMSSQGLGAFACTSASPAGDLDGVR